MTVWIANRQRSIPLRLETYRRSAERVLHRLAPPDAEIGLSFLNDRRMRLLNKAYRGYDRSTDVLAFSFRSGVRRGRKTGSPRPSRGQATGGSPPCFLGDVVVSVPTARRQARERRQSLRREMTRLMIHGILHLLGYDHEAPNEARRMRRMERVLLDPLRPA